MTTCSHEAKDHLDKAHEHLRQAAHAWSDQVIAPEVRSHLRNAARSVLQAGLAAVEAAERRDQQRRQPAAAASVAAATQPA